MPEGFVDWLRRLLARDPAHRFAFAADAAVELIALPDVPDDVVALGDRADTSPVALLPEDLTLIAPPAFLPVGDATWSNGPREDGSPPVPDSWRGPQPPPAEPPLPGVGRSMFGLREPALVGREAQRDELWEALRRVTGGEGAHAAVIEGPTGRGKSCLAHWLAQRAHELGAAFIMRAVHDDVGGPSTGLGPMFENHLRCVGLTGVERLAHLRKALGGATDEPDLPAALAAALEPDRRFAVDDTVVVLSSERERHETFARALRHLTANRPLLLWLEDLQWGPDALRFANYLLDRHPGLAVLLLVTVREDALRNAPGEQAALVDLIVHDNARRVRLPPLDADDLATLITARLPVSPSTVELLVQRSAGSPLFTEELLRHWIRTGAFTEGPDGLRLKVGAELDTPGDLTAVWRARLGSALGKATEAVYLALEAAAIIGMIVAEPEWAAVLEGAGLVVPHAAIERLLDEHLLRAEDGGRWSFAHAMLREALVQRARDAGRFVHWHARCARAIASGGAPDPSRLAGHLVAAGALEDALEPLLAAVREQLKRADYATMQRTLVVRAQALRALRRPSQHADWVETRIHWARLDAVRQRLGPARRRVTRIERDARRIGDPGLLARALIEVGRVGQTDDPERAVRAFTEAATLAGQAGDARTQAEALRRGGWAHSLVGRYDQAEAMHDQAMALLADLDEPWIETGVLHTRALLAFKRGDLERAQQLVEAAQRRSHAIGDRYGVANQTNTLGDILRFRGELAEAERCYREALRLWAAAGARGEDAELNLGLTLLALGRYPEAAVRIGEVMRHAQSIGYTIIVAFAAVSLLPCDAFARNWLAWDARFVHLDQLLTGELAEPDAAEVARMAGEMAAAVGQHRRASDAWALAAAQYHALGRKESAAEMRRKREAALAVADDDEVIFEGTLE